MRKISVYIDDEVWNEFKKEVFQKYGSLRKISSEIESTLKSLIVHEIVASTFKKMGIEVDRSISSLEIKANRPTLRGPPSEEIVSEMRRKRLAENIS
ncbi:MAG: hypothetical protein QXK89_03045 [Candidatus Bathyarchaeia archaeon]